MRFKLVTKLISIVLIVPALGGADNASEREYIRENDPRISEALGVGTMQFEDCFYGTNSQDQYNKQSTLLPCLQKYNPSLTNDQLNAVLDQYRPERN